MDRISFKNLPHCFSIHVAMFTPSLLKWNVPHCFCSHHFEHHYRHLLSSSRDADIIPSRVTKGHHYRMTTRGTSQILITTYAKIVASRPPATNHMKVFNPFSCFWRFWERSSNSIFKPSMARLRLQTGYHTVFQRQYVHRTLGLLVNLFVRSMLVWCMSTLRHRVPRRMFHSGVWRARRVVLERWVRVE